MAFLQLRDQRALYYEETGAGRPVVLIHGWKASANVYAEPARMLAEDGWRCIRYDQCGHLRSQVPAEPPTLATLAEDLREVLTQLRLERPILVGWSMGGMTILEYLRRYGCGDIDRIVLVDIGPKSVNDETWKYGRLNGTYTVSDARAEVALMEQDFHEFMRQYYSVSVPGFRESTEEAQLARIAERMVGHDCRVLTSLWASFSIRDHLDVLPAISCPTAIFHAGLLPSCPPGAAQYYVDHIPAPTYRVCFEGNSHALISEAPERFVAELKRFFAMF